MPAHVAFLVLLSALMHAGWNVLVKHSRDGQLDTVSFALMGSAIAVLWLPWVPLPDAASAPWMAVSLLVHVAYFISLIEAYRHADFSVAYPLMRGMAPVWVCGLAWLAGERLSGQQGLGILLVAVGIVLPAWLGAVWRSGSPRGLVFGLINALIIALYTWLDGMGVRQAGTAIGYTCWMFFFNSWGILAYTVWRRGGPTVLSHARMHWRLSIAAALMSIGAYGIVLWAMTQAPIPAIAALREVSVVFAALMGSRWLHESMGRSRLMGAMLVGVGVMLIKMVDI